VFARSLDRSYAPVVLNNLDRLVWGRLVSNACYRFAPPFIAVIARGLDVTVSQLGVAFMIGEFAGLLSPLIGRYIDRANRLVSMIVGVSLITTAVVVLASAANLVVFGIGMFILSSSKVLFDTSLIVWVNDHVPYERRGRIVGIIETSWALSLFIGVAAMGIATAVFSWRIGFLLGAVAMAVTGILIATGLPRHEAHAPVQTKQRGKLPRNSIFIFISAFFLMGASQCVGITFGPWFEDDFGFTSFGLIVIVVVLGIFELASSIGSSRVTDVWGKEKSVMRGVLAMVFAGLLMTIGYKFAPLAIPMLILYIAGFEFALVSMLPIAANLVPSAGGIGLGLTVGAGTLGRAIFSSVATSLYDGVGPLGPAIAACLLALCTAVCIQAYARSVR
jgi:MFS transporter, DHA1 family, inner membrane transport protein